MSEPRPPAKHAKHRTTPYRRGRDLENRVRRDLECRGFVVIRSTGSGSVADLWAARPGMLLLVQVKRNRLSFGSVEWAPLLHVSREAGASAVLASAELRRPIVYEKLTDYRQRGSRKRPCTVITEEL